MPNIITHTIFAEEVRKNINNSKYYTFIENNINEYRIGCNGPDFMFFYTDLKAIKNKTVSYNKIGSRLHMECINKQYESMIDTYLSLSDETLKPAMASYIIGHFLHWQLDSVFHPYVFYMTGFGSIINKNDHHRMESSMDAIFLKKYCDKTIRDFKTYEICNCKENTDEVIAIVYQNIVKNCFAEEVSKEVFKKSLVDWKKAQKLMYSPKNGKRKLARIFDKIQKNPYLLEGFFVPIEEDQQLDIMNNSHSTWFHPVSGEAYQASAFELMDYAINEAKIGLGYLFDALDGKDIAPLLNHIGDKTYGNGISGNQERHFQDDIYQRSK